LDIEQKEVMNFLKMILNSYKTVTDVNDYRIIWQSIVVQAEKLNNKLIDFNS